MFKCQTIEKIQIKKREREKIFLYLCTRDINNIVYFCLNVLIYVKYIFDAFIPDSTRQIGMFAF